MATARAQVGGVTALASASIEALLPQRRQSSALGAAKQGRAETRKLALLFFRMGRAGPRLELRPSPLGRGQHQPLAGKCFQGNARSFLRFTPDRLLRMAVPRGFPAACMVGRVDLPVAVPVILAIELPLAKNGRTMLMLSRASEPNRSRAVPKDAMAEP
jgi:hypothetical protein